MKKIIIAIALATVVSQAYCESGTQIDKEWVTGIPGSYLVTYNFGGGRILQFKFKSNNNIPYTLRYDFNSMEVCYN